MLDHELHSHFVFNGVSGMFVRYFVLVLKEHIYG